MQLVDTLEPEAQPEDIEIAENQAEALKRSEQVAGLHYLANFLSANPEVPFPNVAFRMRFYTFHTDGKDQFLQTAKTNELMTAISRSLESSVPGLSWSPLSTVRQFAKRKWSLRLSKSGFARR
jgi:hypothetical protein